MKLYHFTGDQFLYGIRTEGITLGMFPIIINEKIVLMKDCQWLTKNESFDQPWHDPELTTLPYDRRRNRLTIKIPKKEENKLWEWKSIKIRFGKFFIPNFDYDEDCENWFIYMGKIKPQWIKKIEKSDSVLV